MFHLLFIGAALLCFVSAADPRCTSSEAYFIPDGRDYRGTINVTSTGIPCQAWAAQLPQQHDVLVPDPSHGLDSNFCRNPFGQVSPGCYTTDPNVRYSTCNVGPVCPYYFVAPSITFAPVPPTLPAGSFVTITCFPQPCQVFYTLDGSTPQQNSSLSYQHGLQLTQSTLVSAIGVLLGGTVLTGQQLFTVTQPPPVSVFFSPDPSAVYTTPILVSLQQLQPSSQVSLFFGTLPTPISYGGPFWLANTTVVTAVINAAQKITASFTIQCPTPVAPNFFPLGGSSYFGRVRILVYQPAQSILLQISINGSSWVPLSAPTYTITAVGTTMFSVQALYLGGVSSYSASANFTVYQANAPTCAPAGNAAYSSAQNISCTDPSGAPLTLTVNGNTSSLSSVLLNTPGNFTVQASYLDDGASPRTATQWYQIVPLPLPQPQVIPCGGLFLGPTIVTVVVPPTQTSSWGLAPSVELLPLTNTTFLLNRSSPFALQLVSFDPMFSNSTTVQCTVNVVMGQYTSFTPVVRVTRPSMLLQSISACLFLPPTSPYVALSPPVGMYQLVQIIQVPPVLVPVYSDRLWQCLGASSNPQRSFGIALNYSVVELAVAVGQLVHLAVSGSNLSTIKFVVVRDEFGCDDIGTPISFNDSAPWSTFTTLFVGAYALCADCGDGFYRVPPTVATQCILFTALPWAPVNAVTPCGGSFPAAQVTVTATGAGGSWSFSVNAGPWTALPSSLVVNVPSTMVVRSGVNAQTCVFLPLQAPLLFQAYDFQVASGYPVRLLLIGGSSQQDASSSLVQVHVSPSCNDTVPLLSSYITPYNGTTWLADAPILLPRLSSVDATLTVCFLNGGTSPAAVLLPPRAVALSPLAASVAPCSASPTGCFQGLPTCIDGLSVLHICNATVAPILVAPDSTLSSATLKMFLFALYVAAVIIVFFVWRNERSHSSSNHLHQQQHGIFHHRHLELRKA